MTETKTLDTSYSKVKEIGENVIYQLKKNLISRKKGVYEGCILAPVRKMTLSELINELQGKNEEGSTIIKEYEGSDKKIHTLVITKNNKNITVQEIYDMTNEMYVIKYILKHLTCKTDFGNCCSKCFKK